MHVIESVEDSTDYQCENNDKLINNIVIERRAYILQAFQQFYEVIMMRIPEMMLSSEEQSMFFSSPHHLQRLPKNTGYREYVHANLRDDNSTQSFRAHYRMNKTTFQKLVEVLEEHPAYQLRAHNATPTFIQVAMVLWRYSNNHFGFRMSQATMGFSQISWPSTVEEFEQVQHDFEHPSDEFGPKKLPGVIGAVDGKLITIHRPKKTRRDTGTASLIFQLA
ncbi:unnamed protein product [Mucor hiemalis]